MDSAEDILHETQIQLTQIADAMDDATGVDRRQFVFMSLVAAAATTFGVDVVARPSGRRRRRHDSAAARATTDSTRQR
jgi:hypothetical protein